MTFHISAAADAQVTAAAVFYDAKPNRYGDEFKAEFARAARAILANPRIYPLVEDGVPGREIREYFIERFKQRVIYQMNGDDVLVVAVVHASRREGTWHRNLPTDPPPEATRHAPPLPRRASAAPQPPVVPARLRRRPRGHRPERAVGRSTGG